MKDQGANIVFLHETDEEQINLASLSLQGFKKVVGKESSNGKVRQMAFISEEIDFQMRSDLSSGDMSSLWIEIDKPNHKNIILCGVYRRWGDKNSDEISSEKQINVLDWDEIRSFHNFL